MFYKRFWRAHQRLWMFLDLALQKICNRFLGERVIINPEEKKTAMTRASSTERFDSVIPSGILKKWKCSESGRILQAEFRVIERIECDSGEWDELNDTKRNLMTNCRNAKRWINSLLLECERQKHHLTRWPLPASAKFFRNVERQDRMHRNWS